MISQKLIKTILISFLLTPWFLFVFSQNIHSSSITLNATFPQQITIGEDVDVQVTLVGATESYNLKVYASPTKNSRHSSYVETKNGNKYITTGWENYPQVSEGTNNIGFRLKKYDESGKIYLRVGINAGSNIYSDWVEVSIKDFVEETSSAEPEIVTNSEQEEEKAEIKVDFEEDVYFNDDNIAKIEIKNTDKKYYVKILGSINKKNYGYIKTINKKNLLSWNTSWDNLPIIEGENEEEIRFFLDTNLEEIYLKARAREVDSSSYIESEYTKVTVITPEVLGEDVSEEVLVEEEIVENKESIKEEEPEYFLDTNGYEYKKVAINLQPKNTNFSKTIIYDNSQEYSEKQPPMIGFSIWNLFQTLWTKLGW